MGCHGNGSKLLLRPLRPCKALGCWELHPRCHLQANKHRRTCYCKPNEANKRENQYHCENDGQKQVALNKAGALVVGRPTVPLQVPRLQVAAVNKQLGSVPTCQNPAKRERTRGESTIETSGKRCIRTTTPRRCPCYEH